MASLIIFVFKLRRVVALRFEDWLALLVDESTPDTFPKTRTVGREQATLDILKATETAVLAPSGRVNDAATRLEVLQRILTDWVVLKDTLVVLINCNEPFILLIGSNSALDALAADPLAAIVNRTLADTQMNLLRRPLNRLAALSRP